MRLLLVFLTLGFAGCSPKNVQKNAVPPALSSPQWSALVGQPFELTVLKAGGKDIAVPATRRPTIRFQENGGVSGMAGVNRYSTSGELDGRGGIAWKGPLTSTKMAGPAEAMELENRFLDALQAASRIALAGGKLTLTSADGANRLELGH